MTDRARPALARCRLTPPEGYSNGGVRRCYVPQAEDLALVGRLFPKLADPGNPPWPRVEAELGADGRRLYLYKMGS